jgi:hypothetical protein
LEGEEQSSSFLGSIFHLYQKKKVSITVPPLSSQSLFVSPYSLASRCSWVFWKPSKTHIFQPFLGMICLLLMLGKCDHLESSIVGMRGRKLLNSDPWKHLDMLMVTVRHSTHAVKDKSVNIDDLAIQNAFLNKIVKSDLFGSILKKYTTLIRGQITI